MQVWSFWWSGSENWILAEAMCERFWLGQLCHGPLLRDHVQALFDLGHWLGQNLSKLITESLSKRTTNVFISFYFKTP
jgi:hypothetical protein